MLIKFQDEAEFGSCTSKYLIMVSLVLVLKTLNIDNGSNE